MEIVTGVEGKKPPHHKSSLFSSLVTSATSWAGSYTGILGFNSQFSLDLSKLSWNPFLVWLPQQQKFFDGENKFLWFMLTLQ